MKVKGRPWRSIWPHPDGKTVEIIDQTKLPHVLETRSLKTLEDAAEAIAVMRVRGAPLIGATAAYGLCLALHTETSDERLDEAAAMLAATRPTAVNLQWALDVMTAHLKPLAPIKRLAAAYERAAKICHDDVAVCRAIAGHGAEIITDLAGQPGRQGPVNILTHCNAGWLATIDWGTALAPIYLAHDQGLALHVWVDETRPRNQGAGLTAWELANHGVPHTVIADNAGGHLMQQGRVDLCITGTDRTLANGDVCNKIGTYLKALAAHDNGVPFYVALPHSTIDWTGNEIPIEERPGDEVTHVTGLGDDGKIVRVRITPEGSAAHNPAFDITPARLITGLITERGVCAASAEGLRGLYSERQGE